MSPIDFVDYPDETLLYSKMRQLQAKLRECREIGAEIAGKFDHAAADPDYSGVETLLGLTAGEGVTVYNLFTGAYARVNHDDVKGFIDRVISK